MLLALLMQLLLAKTKIMMQVCRFILVLVVNFNLHLVRVLIVYCNSVSKIFCQRFHSNVILSHLRSKVLYILHMRCRTHGYATTSKLCNNSPMECGTTSQPCNNFAIECGTTSHWNAVNCQTHNVMSQLFTRFNIQSVNLV